MAGWLVVGRLLAEKKKKFSDVGTHLPNVQSTVNITPITKIYTENLMRLFLNSDDLCYLGHPTRHTTTAASAGSKKKDPSLLK